MHFMKAFAAVAATCVALAPATVRASIDLIVPAYFYPSSVPALNEWNTLTASLAANPGASVTAIMNPDNGPGAAFNGDYETAVNAFRDQKGKVLGYVYTCYGNNNCQPRLPPTRSANDVIADAQRYAGWYQVDGIFLDEMSSNPAVLSFYERIANGLRGPHPDWTLMGNPGVNPDKGYFGAANSLVTFEGSFEKFINGAFLRELSNPASSIALIYEATEAQMLTAIGLARQAGLGGIYVTDRRYNDNPWLGLPSYWSAQVAASVSAVHEPSSMLLMAGGLAAVAALGRRRAREALQASPIRRADCLGPASAADQAPARRSSSMQSP